MFNKNKKLKVYSSPTSPLYPNDEENILDKNIDSLNEKEQETPKIEQDEQNKEQDKNELSDILSINNKSTDNEELNIDDFLNNL